VAITLGIISTLAVLLINFAIQLWQQGEQLTAAIFFIIGGLLFIIGSYYNLSFVAKLATKEKKTE